MDDKCGTQRAKLLVFIVAYNAEETIVSVLDRIPPLLAEQYDVSVLIIDDCSADKSFDVACAYAGKGFWCPIQVLRNTKNLGYGGNQKVGYVYAETKGFDIVALVHGDGQYAPEMLPELVAPIRDNAADAVFGSRMLAKGEALRGGMPLYKYIGNKILTRIQNALLNTNLSEFHTGYRAYSVKALRAISYALNTDDFHFDTEIIVQLVFSGARIAEHPIPTYYGDEVCHVNGLKYAKDVLIASLQARCIRLGIFYDQKYHTAATTEENYTSKLNFVSTHSTAYDKVATGSTVLDMGCASGHLSRKLALEKKCTVYACDITPDLPSDDFCYSCCDLNTSLPDIPWDSTDYIILLDIIEHLDSPELFLKRLRYALSSNTKVNVVISAGNVAFLPTRLMLLLGHFNYGYRGILDMTHKRLFTTISLRRALTQSGYTIQGETFIPAPFPLAFGNGKIASLLLFFNRLFLFLPNMFAYQALYTCTLKPSPEWLLDSAMTHSARADR